MKENVNTNKKSLAMMTGSMLIFGTIGIFRRYIPLSSALLAAFRGMSGAVFLILIAIITRKKIKHGLPAKTVALLAFTGALIGINWIFLFEAYNYTTVATATLCYYMEPIFVILAAPLVLRERLTLRKAVCGLAAIIGMVLVSGVVETGIPQIGEIKGILFGLSAAALYATVVLINKKMPVVDAYEKTIIQLMSAAVVLIPYLLITEDFTKFSPNATTIVMMIVVGLVHTGLAYAMYFKSMEGLSGQTVALLGYIDPVTALILSAVVLNEHMGITGIIGAILIIGAAIIGG